MSSTLIICGSYAPGARAQVEQLADQGALVLTLNRDAVLGQDESFLMGIRSGAAAAIKQGRTVVVRSENWPEAVEVVRRLGAKRGIPVDELEARVRNMLARVVLGVVQSVDVRQIIVLGTETGTAVREVLGEGASRVQLVLLPGSGGKPGALAEAVARLDEHKGSWQ